MSSSTPGAVGVAAPMENVNAARGSCGSPPIRPASRRRRSRRRSLRGARRGACRRRPTGRSDRAEPGRPAASTSRIESPTGSTDSLKVSRISGGCSARIAWFAGLDATSSACAKAVPAATPPTRATTRASTAHPRRRSADSRRHDSGQPASEESCPARADRARKYTNTPSPSTTTTVAMKKMVPVSESAAVICSPEAGIDDSGSVDRPWRPPCRSARRRCPGVPACRTAVPACRTGALGSTAGTVVAGTVGGGHRRGEQQCRRRLVEFVARLVGDPDPADLTHLAALDEREEDRGVRRRWQRHQHRERAFDVVAGGPPVKVTTSPSIEPSQPSASSGSAFVTPSGWCMSSCTVGDPSHPCSTVNHDSQRRSGLRFGRVGVDVSQSRAAEAS